MGDGIIIVRATVGCSHPSSAGTTSGLTAGPSPGHAGRGGGREDWDRGGCRGMRSVGIKDLRGVGFDFFLKSKLYLCS